MASIKKRPDGKYRRPLSRRAREGTRSPLPAEGRRAALARRQTASVVTGAHVDPKRSRRPSRPGVNWLEGYATRRPSTVRQASAHRQIKPAFGPIRLGDVRPSQVKAWTGRMKAEGLPTRPSTRPTDAWRRSWATRSTTGSSPDPRAAGDVARPGLAAALRGYDGAGMGPPRCDAGALPPGRPPRCVRRPADLRGMPRCASRRRLHAWRHHRQRSSGRRHRQVRDLPDARADPARARARAVRSRQRYGGSTVVADEAGAPWPLGHRAGCASVARRTSRDCPRASASTTCGTTSRPCSSPAVPTSRSCRAPAPRVRDDDAQHVRAHVARRRRVRPHCRC